MTWSLLLLCAAASAVIAFSTSALVGAGLALSRRILADLTAAARARVLFGATLLPMLACISLMTAALAPSFGWIVDHCFRADDTHHLHPHLCAAHHVSVLPAGTLMALAGLSLLRLCWSLGRMLRGAVDLVLTKRALWGISRSRDENEIRVLPFAQPQAFVVGILPSVIFVTQGLLSDAYEEHLEPALLHERAHLRRRDPLRRFIASIALAFHLPGIAMWMERQLARAHEMAADADAAKEMNSPERVAFALVRLARAQQQTSRMVLAFGESDVEARIATLLDDRVKHDRPHQAVLITGAMLLFTGIGLGADTVHHTVEIVLGLLSG